ncbi:hypothetical protein KO506_03215 [Polaribacter vadi]|uniref:hypothetical protein n=1 Tax=Polaribacter TaxID=52959 RepID=UPI001C0815EA|nr:MULTISPECIES: hypothetical protein [Polaribacter]MBU3010397.1 hypothetical protein [Polaribacter vadi]MDO6740205.1 hypothetical protein [Polaribacter sp. 1_MG-2023]
MRVFSFLILMIFCTSCDKFSFSKNKNVQVVDTIVDYTSVDTFPSFKVCDSFIDKIKKQDCFRNTIHQKIGEELQKHIYSIKDSIDTTVLVDLIINAKGEIVFDGLQSENIEMQLPELQGIIRNSINNLPTVLPAVKRGIPVTTKYQLPIRILLKE